MEAVDAKDGENDHVKNDHEHIHFRVSLRVSRVPEVGATIRRGISRKCHRNVICCTETSQIGVIAEDFGLAARGAARLLRSPGLQKAIACSPDSIT